MRELIQKTYEAEDGTIFDSADDCREHERAMARDAAWHGRSEVLQEQVMSFLGEAFHRNKERFHESQCRAILAWEKEKFFDDWEKEGQNEG